MENAKLGQKTRVLWSLGTDGWESCILNRISSRQKRCELKHYRSIDPYEGDLMRDRGIERV